MKTKKYSERQIAGILKEGASGTCSRIMPHAPLVSHRFNQPLKSFTSNLQIAGIFHPNQILLKKL